MPEQESRQAIKMKVVLDTNVIVSAIFWRGNTRKILQSVAHGSIKMYTSPFLLKELERVLNYPKFKKLLIHIKLKPQQIIEAIEEYAQLTTKDITVNIITEDPADNYVLSCALAAKANFIVTGDKHLLSLDGFDGIRIIKPRHFLEEIR